MDKKKYNELEEGDIITYNTILYDISNLLKWNFLIVLKKIEEIKRNKKCIYMILISNRIRLWSFYEYKDYLILK